VTVTAKEKGAIEVDAFTDFSGQVKRWQPIGPLLYRAANGQEKLAFLRDGQGRWQIVAGFPAVVYQRASFLQDMRFNQPLLIGALSIMALTLLFWPIAALVRRHYHQRLEMDAPQRRGRLWVRLACAVNIAFVLVMLQTLSSNDPGAFTERHDLRLNLVQAGGVLGALGTLLVLVACLRFWRDPSLWFWTKVWNGLVFMACAAFTWFVLYWNLLDFGKNY
jgi:hypothetical protein